MLINKRIALSAVICNFIYSALCVVPLLCGECGVYNKYADLDSRCRYIKAVKQNLNSMHIPGILWDYNANFSIFDGKPTVSNLPDCMKDAIGYVTKK